jgi:type IV fimbrial biogenesis protein FimT
MPGSVGHGCGLGLAIVDEISRLHDANLTIYSGASGRGARLRVGFRGSPSETHVAIRRSVMTYGESPSAPRKLVSLESAPVNGNFPLDRTIPEAHTVSQPADPILTTPIGFAAAAARGFSLIELITVMTVVGIIVAIAVPSYKYVTNSSRVSAEINQFLGDLQYARSEAVKEGSTVSVCPSSNAATAGVTSPTCTNGANWQVGWMVFSDVTGTGSFAAGDQVLRAQPAFTSTDTLVSSDPTVTSIIFNREGFTLSIPSSDSTASTAAGVTTYSGLMINLNTSPTNQRWERCLQIAYAGIMAVMQGGTNPCT